MLDGTLQNKEKLIAFTIIKDLNVINNEEHKKLINKYENENQEDNRIHACSCFEVWIYENTKNLCLSSFPSWINSYNTLCSIWINTATHVASLQYLNAITVYAMRVVIKEVLQWPGFSAPNSAGFFQQLGQPFFLINNIWIRCPELFLPHPNNIL